MLSGKQTFFLKVAIAGVVIVLGLGLVGTTFEATQVRFGGLGIIHWMSGLLCTGLGVLALWAMGISILDHRALTRYRVDAGGDFEDGQVIALSGILRTKGQPLIAPFSRIPCAAYTYEVIGRRKSPGSSGSDSTAQLCLSGAHLADVVLETGVADFRLLAVPDVDTDFRENSLGGDWGDLGMGMILAASEAEDPTPEPQARGGLDDLRRHAAPPVSEDRFISTSISSAASLTVNEDAIPVDEPVTLLGTYVGNGPGLDGQRLGGLKVFKGGFEERIPALRAEIRTSLKIGLPSLVIGVGLQTLALWWPG